MVNGRRKSSISNKRPRRGRRAMPDKRIARVVKRVMARSQEVKVNRYAQNGTLYSPANNVISWQAVNGDLWCITPHSSFCSIVPGTGESDRIGTKIKIKSVRLRANFWASPYNASTNPTPIPFYLRISIFSVKYSSQLSDVQNVIVSNFYNSNASSVGIAGTMYDMTGPINNNYVTLKKVIIRKLGVSSTYGTGGTAATQYFNNNDFKITSFLNIDVTKYVRKNISFNDSTGTASTTATWVVLDCIPFNNDTTNFGSTPGTYSMDIETKYTDS